MSRVLVAPKTETCGAKKPYPRRDAAMLAVVHHDRSRCWKCRRGKVLDIYACGRHHHVGHRALGY
jgi:hypothetical protein